MIREVTVISGKGGTGKTSLVGSLAYFAENKVMVDCDVDAADLHLILRGNNLASHDFIGSQKAVIDYELCNDCGLCLEYCRFDAIGERSETSESDARRYYVDSLACEGCGICAEFCPTRAIRMVDHVSGRWFFDDTEYGPLVHARLGIAEANSGKLVSLLRKTARDLAEKNNHELIIIDGSPGIGCPVIASLTGVDYALIVTEPTVAAVHDMERLLELTGHFGIHTGICINKCDLNRDMTDKIVQLAATAKIEVLSRIPYDTSVTRAQMAGLPYPEFRKDGVTKNFHELWNNLIEDMNRPHRRSRTNNVPLIQLGKPTEKEV